MPLYKTICAIISAVIMLVIAANNPVTAEDDGSPVSWGYKGKEAANHWGDLSSRYKMCKEGKMQSPINVIPSAKAEMHKIKFKYSTIPLKVVNDGHTIKINYPEGSYMIADEKKYDLLQLHFHTPSEHQINGKSYDMEMHMVHASHDEKTAVIAVMIKKGRHNDEFEKILANMPRRAGGEVIKAYSKFNPSGMLPDDFSYYRFMGSLTTPPCTEGISWYVFAMPIEASLEQIAKFRTIYDMNARPIQETNERLVIW